MVEIAQLPALVNVSSILSSYGGTATRGTAIMRRQILIGTAIAMSFATQAAHAAGVFALEAYSATFTFADQLPATTMPLAFDGTNYYSSSGGGSDSPYAMYGADGSLIMSASPTPGLDFRSIFTDASGTLYARGFADPTIYQQTSFGNFSAFTTLNGGSLDDQSAVVQDIGGVGYVAESGGTVSRWDANGMFTGTTTLDGFSGSEADYPPGRGIAVDGNYWLTYDPATSILSAWDTSGTRVGTTALTDGGTSFDSGFSYSYANNMFFVADSAGDTWRGYDVGLGGATPVPEPMSFALLGTGLVGLGVLRLRKRSQGSPDTTTAAPPARSDH